MVPTTGLALCLCWRRVRKVEQRTVMGRARRISGTTIGLCVSTFTTGTGRVLADAPLGGLARGLKVSSDRLDSPSGERAYGLRQ
jgi:hypothetical protein